MTLRVRALALLVLGLAAVGGLTYGALREDAPPPSAQDGDVRVVLREVSSAPEGGSRADVLVGNADGRDEHVEARFSGFEFHALRGTEDVLRGEVFGARHERTSVLPGDTLRFTVDFEAVPEDELEAVAVTYTHASGSTATLWVRR